MQLALSSRRNFPGGGNGKRARLDQSLALRQYDRLAQSDVEPAIFIKPEPEAFIRLIG
jgi:hypothetical protein